MYEKSIQLKIIIIPRNSERSSKQTARILPFISETTIFAAVLYTNTVPFSSFMTLSQFWIHCLFSLKFNVQWWNQVVGGGVEANLH